MKTAASQPTNAPSHDTDPQDELSLLDLLTSLWSGKWLILACTVLSMICGAIWVLRTPPAYRAEGLLQLEKRAGGLALPSGMQDLLDGGSSSGSVGATEMAILRSRLVLRRAVVETGLDLTVTPRPLPILGNLPARLRLPDPEIAILRPYAWGNESVELGALDLSEALLGESILLTITGPNRFEITLPEGQTLTGKVGRRLEAPELGLSLLVDRLTGPIGREFILQRRASDLAVAQASAAFTAEESPRGSSLLRLTYTAETPRRAELILDAIIRAYVDQNIQRSSAEAQNSLDFIEEQLPLAEAEMARAQEALNLYRQEQNSVDVDYETRNLLEQVTKLESELNALALQEEELKKRYTPNHPTYQSLLETRAALESRLERLRAQTTDLPQTQREIFNLTRNLEVAQQVYIQLLNRAQELRVVRASTVGSVRIVDAAWSSGQNVNLGLAKGLAYSLAIGLFFGSLLTLAIRFLRRGVSGAEEIEQLGLPVFATVPHTPLAPKERRRGPLGILAMSHPDEITVESLRSLRTALQFGLVDAQSRSITLTSPAPDTGKSFTAINLAVVAAQSGQSVCLIDADLRRGYLRRFLDVPRETPGLTEFLAGQKTLDDILLRGPVPGLGVITTGRYPPNPSELLMRPKFAELLHELGWKYDLILVDTPPVLAVTDPVIIARQTGAVLLLTRHLKTMPGQISAAQKTLQNAGVKIAGAVLNDFKQSKASKYSYQVAYSYSYKTRKM